jgi:hypothetical protein
MRQVICYLSVIWDMLAVISQLQEGGWLFSVRYIRQDDCYLSTTWGRLLVSISYMKQYDGYLSVTRGGLTVICQLHGACYRCLSVT